MTAWIDDLNNPIASYAGNSTTLPDTLKNVILQQECSGLGMSLLVLGVFDSGVGGQSVINAIKKELPDLKLSIKPIKNTCHMVVNP
jgi:hypothetical protein